MPAIWEIKKKYCPAMLFRTGRKSGEPSIRRLPALGGTDSGGIIFFQQGDEALGLAGQPLLLPFDPAQGDLHVAVDDGLAGDAQLGVEVPVPAHAEGKGVGGAQEVDDGPLIVEEEDPLGAVQKADAVDDHVGGDQGEVVVGGPEDGVFQQVPDGDLGQVVEGAVGAQVGVPGVVADGVELQLAVFQQVAHLAALDLVDVDDAQLRAQLVDVVDDLGDAGLPKGEVDAVFPVALMLMPKAEVSN